MFFSLLYLLSTLAVLLFTFLAIRSIVKNEPAEKWVMSMIGVTFAYLFLVAVSVWL
ncbi:hypothetical protein ACFO25_18805 [Paenactinomyces guangxiensis]|uniref:Uncharacterized protein n=1 Tax=Paenactinomyces guangxiensis TaxID=1490290 RepID=A0A7W1WR91_9BACL|nr:hypothetical protein [Paenactinomyces guangxiensis]MBA4494497.1 hypothetical protein [Paenactinomyces guangxiensis]MBH8591448.1 hypothetical protein [Paenactinomyces guangxiensis]